MLYSFIIATSMVVGVYFIREVQKAMGTLGQHASMMYVVMMFTWDGVFIYFMKGYTTKEELAMGIVLGTLVKTLAIIKTNSLQSIEDSRR